MIDDLYDVLLVGSHFDKKNSARLFNIPGIVVKYT